MRVRSVPIGAGKENQKNWNSRRQDVYNLRVWKLSKRRLENVPSMSVGNLKVRWGEVLVETHDTLVLTGKSSLVYREHARRGNTSPAPGPTQTLGQFLSLPICGRPMGTGESTHWENTYGERDASLAPGLLQTLIWFRSVSMWGTRQIGIGWSAERISWVRKGPLGAQCNGRHVF